MHYWLTKQTQKKKLIRVLNADGYAAESQLQLDNQGTGEEEEPFLNHKQ